MSDIRGALNSFSQTYGRPALLALLLHAALLAVLLQTEFTPLPLAKPPLTEPAVSEPIVSYLYQPPRPAPAEVQQPAREDIVTPEVVQSAPANTVPPAVAEEQRPASQQQRTAAALPDRADKLSTEHTATAPRQSLAQRAFNRTTIVDPVAIEQAAQAAYQQFVQTQQQPKMTVEKRHQELSANPAQQVVAELGDGIQLIRIKGGCRIGDPAKDGFDGLMAARVVPCGDEAKTSDLLKQALEKHSKR